MSDITVGARYLSQLCAWVRRRARHHRCVTERMRDEIKQMVDRTGKNAAYYAALDLQHFGPTPSASNFVDFDSVEEALEAVWEARGDFAGNDRARLLALGAESEALLGEIGR